MTPSGVQSRPVSSIFSSVTGSVVDLEAATLDLAPRLAVRRDQAGAHEGHQHPEPALELGARDLDRRQRFRQTAFLERPPRGLGGLGGGGTAVQERGRLGRQHLLGFVELVTLERAQPADLLERQLGEQLHEAHDVAVLAVAPELPVVVGTHHLGIEPDRAAFGLAHLHPRRRGQERRGQCEQLGFEHTASELDAVDDIAPLIRAAHLQDAAVTLVQLHEIVGLQDHVVEFEERQRLLALQPQLDRVEGQHPVDREMTPDVAQERNVAQLVQPIRIVGRDGAGVEIEEPREHGANLGDVGVDLLVREQRAGGVLAGGIADLAGAAAHQHDRAVAGLLQPAQHHDRQEVADMQARCGGVEADIGGDRALCGARIEPGRVRELMNEAPARQHVEKFGFVGAHGLSSRLIASLGPVVYQVGAGIQRMAVCPCSHPSVS